MLKIIIPDSHDLGVILYCEICKCPAFQKHCPHTSFLPYLYLQLDQEELFSDTQPLW